MSDTRKKRQAKRDASDTDHRRLTHYEAAVRLSVRVNRKNKHFANYCPEWLRRALEPIDITPEQFVMIRRHRLYMTQEQCAGYLRVSVSTVSAWENGHTPIPFMAFETIRLMAETMDARLTHPEWEGWSVSKHGELCSPDNTVRLSESAVRSYHFMVANVMPALRSDIRQLQHDLDEARETVRKASEIMQQVDDAQRMKLAKAVVRALFDAELSKDTDTPADGQPDPLPPSTLGRAPDLQIPPKRTSIADHTSIDTLLNLSNDRRNTP